MKNLSILFTVFALTAGTVFGQFSTPIRNGELRTDLQTDGNAIVLTPKCGVDTYLDSDTTINNQAYLYPDKAPVSTQTSGALTIGKYYEITTYLGSDDFTNVGAASNASGVVFKATGDTPTNWAGESVVSDITHTVATTSDVAASASKWKEDDVTPDASTLIPISACHTSIATNVAGTGTLNIAAETITVDGRSAISYTQTGCTNPGQTTYYMADADPCASNKILLQTCSYVDPTGFGCGCCPVNINSMKLTVPSGLPSVPSVEGDVLNLLEVNNEVFQDRASGRCCLNNLDLSLKINAPGSTGGLKPGTCVTIASPGSGYSAGPQTVTIGDLCDGGATMSVCLTVDDACGPCVGGLTCLTVSACETNLGNISINDLLDVTGACGSGGQVYVEQVSQIANPDGNAQLSILSFEPLSNFNTCCGVLGSCFSLNYPSADGTQALPLIEIAASITNCACSGGSNSMKYYTPDAKGMSSLEMLSVCQSPSGCGVGSFNTSLNAVTFSGALAPNSCLTVNNVPFTTVDGDLGILSSCAGASWEQKQGFQFPGTTVSSCNRLNSVAYDGTTYVAVGGRPNNYLVAARSTDGGLNWSSGSICTAQALNRPLCGVAGDGCGTFVAVGERGNVIVSTNSGANFNTSTVCGLGTINMEAVLWDGCQFLISGQRWYISPDGLAPWTQITTPSNPRSFDLAYDGTHYVSVGSGGNIYTTADSRVNALNGGTLCGGTSGYVDATCVPTTASCSGTGLTVDITASCGIVTSVDINANGANYVPAEVITITGGAGDATIEVNLVGGLAPNSNWAQKRNNLPAEVITNNFNGVATSGVGNFAAVGNNGKIITSTDNGHTWTVQDSGVTVNLRKIVYDSTNSKYVVVGDEGTTLTSSSPFTSWTEVNAGTTNDLYGIEFDASATEKLIAVGQFHANTDASRSDQGTRYTVQAAPGYCGVGSMCLDNISDPDLCTGYNPLNPAVGECFVANVGSRQPNDWGTGILVPSGYKSGTTVVNGAIINITADGCGVITSATTTYTGGSGFNYQDNYTFNDSEVPFFDQSSFSFNQNDLDFQSRSRSLVTSCVGVGGCGMCISTCYNVVTSSGVTTSPGISYRIPCCGDVTASYNFVGVGIDVEPGLVFNAGYRGFCCNINEHSVELNVPHPCGSNSLDILYSNSGGIPVSCCCVEVGTILSAPTRNVNTNQLNTYDILKARTAAITTCNCALSVGTEIHAVEVDGSGSQLVFEANSGATDGPVCNAIVVGTGINFFTAPGTSTRRGALWLSDRLIGCCNILARGMYLYAPDSACNADLVFHYRSDLSILNTCDVSTEWVGTEILYPRADGVASSSLLRAISSSNCNTCCNAYNIGTNLYFPQENTNNKALGLEFVSSPVCGGNEGYEGTALFAPQSDGNGTVKVLRTITNDVNTNCFVPPVGTTLYYPLASGNNSVPGLTITAASETCFDGLNAPFDRIGTILSFPNVDGNNSQEGLSFYHSYTTNSCVTIPSGTQLSTPDTTGTAAFEILDHASDIGSLKIYSVTTDQSSILYADRDTRYLEDTDTVGARLHFQDTIDACGVGTALGDINLGSRTANFYLPRSSPLDLVGSCSPPTLIACTPYEIVSVVGCDNFTSSGAANNCTGTVFVYNGTPPTFANVGTVVSPNRQVISSPITGLTSPEGSVTPNYVGEIYVDTTNDDGYMAVGLTSSDWKKITP
jgi:hypothetical protein